MSKTKSTKITQYALVVVNVLLLALTVLGVIKSVFVGFDVDEGYAIAQSYRLVMGDNMFTEMWEPHQMSSFALAFMIAPYLLITGGETAGIVLYLRVLGNVIHLLIGWWFYTSAKKRFGTTAGLLVAVAHVNFLPKWLVVAEFEIMHYWAVCIMFLAFLAWQERVVLNLANKETLESESKVRSKKFFSFRKEDWYLILAGAALFMAMMTYPTMIALYPVYAIAIFALKGPKAKDKWRGWLIFTGVTFIIGVIFLLYLRSYMTVDEFLQNISYIFMDDSHKKPLSLKCYHFSEELKHIGRQLVRYSPVPLGMTGLIAIVDVIVGIRSKRGEKPWHYILKFVLIFALLMAGVFVGKHFILALFTDINQFFIFFRYGIAVLAILVALFMCIRKASAYFWLGILPGLVSLVASAMITNMTLEISFARMYIAIMAGIYIVATLIKDKFKDDVAVKATAYAVMVAFILGLMVCKIVQVRVNSCVPYKMNADMDWVTCGPIAGVLVPADKAQMFNANIPELREYIDEDDTLLYFGCEDIYYLVPGAKLATPTVQGTTVFNEMFLKYYEEHPDRIPDVVVKDKLLGVDLNYHYDPGNAVMEEWIEENFADAEVIETEYFIILKK